MENNCAVILSAGDGKRMKSAKPKALCEVALKPMLSWVISSCESANISDLCLVTGSGSDFIENYYNNQYETAFQAERKGTGHAVLMAEKFLKKFSDGQVLILCGDAPFIDADTITRAYNQHTEQKNAATIITANLPDPTGYGRIIRTANGVSGIVEQKDATESQKAINEINSGAFWFNVSDLLSILGKLSSDNSQNEYYLTETIELLNKENKNVNAFISDNADVVLGANDRKTLHELNEIARKKIFEKHFENGVDIPCTDGIIISPDVKIGADTTILPNTILSGNTVIGQCCKIGPSSCVSDSVLGDNVTLNATQVYESKIHSDVKIGPFSHVRPNSEIKSGVKIGDFVEIKNSVIDEKTSVSHLTYIGDSDVGKGVNFGCGTVTVNYDGVNKYRTTIGDNCFIGCNTNLISPVKLGDYAYTAAGSTINQDVPDGALAIARSKQEIKPDYAFKKLNCEK